jgi:single-strand DNA-binding protein
MNKAILFGNTGKDPEVKTIGENKVAKFSLATQSFRKDSNGNKVTDWHNIVCWSKLADLAEKWIKKGSSLIIEGEIQYRDYTDKDGVKKYITEIMATSIHFAGKKESDSKQEQAKQEPETWHGKKQVDSMSNIEDLPGAKDERDLPF